MFTLAFDTTFKTLSIALFYNKDPISTKIISKEFQHCELIISEIENILAEKNIWYQDLKIIAVNKGPGSFTGTRVGLAVAKMLKLSINANVFAISSFEALAYNFKNYSKKIFIVVNSELNDEVFLTSAILENNFPKINNDVSMFKLEKLEDEINKIDQSLICFLNINEQEFENKKDHFIKTKNNSDIIYLIAIMAIDAYNYYQKNNILPFESLSNLSPIYNRVSYI
jgi:tRNA threonylcarbamoyladenosine biosynthesis protein TsaB